MFRKSVTQELECLLHVGIIEAKPGEVESGTFTETIAFAKASPTANENQSARVEEIHCTAASSVHKMGKNAE